MSYPQCKECGCYFLNLDKSLEEKVETECTHEISCDLHKICSIFMSDEDYIVCAVCGEKKHWPYDIDYVLYHSELERDGEFVCFECN